MAEGETMTDALLVAAILLVPLPVTLVAMRYREISPRRVVMNAAALAFYGPGYVAGAVVRFVGWARAAIVAGYKHGRG